ncbi:glycosyltransferase [Coraliomargarita sp. W4R53]
MRVVHKFGDDPHTDPIAGDLARMQWWAGKKLSKIAEHLQYDKTGAFYSANFFGSSLLHQIQEIQPDIVHLHWLGSDTLTIKQLAKIDIPIVWTMHDMWPFCGAEHWAFPWSGKRYAPGYTRQNRDKSSLGIDINRVTWERKAQHWKGMRMHTVVSSKWMQTCANESQLTRIAAFRPAKLIYLGINRNVFYPEDKTTCRKRLEIKENERVLLFGAHMNRIPTKGFQYLVEALKQMDMTQPTTLISFGAGKLPAFPNLRVIQLGEINEPKLLQQAYCASDLFLMPSLIESFGLVAAESMACGTPVVCFDTTGLRDVVGHKTEGYRAQQFDSEDFCRGIQWCLENTERLKTMSKNAQAKVEMNFSLEQMCLHYQTFYEEILNS